MKKGRRKNKIIVFMLVILLTAGLFSPAYEVLAAKIMEGVSNPGDIVITTPKDGYSTTASRVSILGASDYDYPLYLNGSLVETTEHGFFTVYVDLVVGKNEFLFTNGEGIKSLTINRKEIKPSTSSGSQSGVSTTPKVAYKEYTTDSYGIIVANYAMPRTKTSESDINLMPLVKGTAVQILGEYGSYYKIIDGTYVSKSSMTLYKKALAENKITKAVVKDDTKKNVIVAELTSNVNAMHAVKLQGNKITLTLYGTTKVKKPTIQKNDTLKSVITSVNTKNKTVSYIFNVRESGLVTGYDIFFRDGKIIFELKKAPHLKSPDSLQGAVVYLDAGHGKADNGALGPLSTLGPTEKNINLAITLYAKEYLEAEGAKVVLTRTDDTFLSLSERVNAIRTTSPDISVSIHGNSLSETANYSASSGLLTFYSYTLFKDVPSQINQSVARITGLQARDTRRSSLSLTRLTACPALLIETSFLSNPNDYEYLIQVENQKTFGKAIASAIKEYLERYAVYEQQKIIHEVKAGDSLSAIAVKYGVPMSKIIQWNQLKDANHIMIGQNLRIFK